MPNVNKYRYDINMAGLKEQVLNKEQMAHLKELGIDTTNASVVLIYQDEDGNEVDWEDVNIRDGEPIYVDEDGDEWDLTEEYLDAETGRYDHSYRESCGVFTLEDILKVLPYKICDAQLGKIKADIWLGFEFDKICYTRVDDSIVVSEEFDALSQTYLEAASNILLWVAEHGYLNKE